jgi:hypothetical protein
MAAAFGATFVLGLLATLAGPAVVLASCAMPPALEQSMQTAEVVFIGTVTSTTNRNTWASVAVDEVWRGPDQPANVIVRGGPAGNAATSVDRAFEPGVKYIFFPYSDEAGLADNSCTNTQPWTDDMAALRPADARPPIAGSDNPSAFDLGGVLPPLAVAVVVGVVLLGVGFVARGRQSG